MLISSAVADVEEGQAAKKKKRKAGKKKSTADKGAAAAKKEKAEKPKTALSMPDEDEEEIDLVARMEEARRAMPNACVVSPISARFCQPCLWHTEAARPQ